MHLSGSPPDLARALVGDASFWINVVATKRVERLLRAISASPTITDVAFAELERGRSKGRVAVEVVASLVQAGTVNVVRCAPEDEEVFTSLIVGSATETLDDGEAATLVCAARAGFTAVIDERKATSIAAIRFPELQVLSTVDLLLGARVRAIVGQAELAGAIFDALTGARMRVPRQHLDGVVELLGPERISVCQSLPSRIRTLERQGER